MTILFAASEAESFTVTNTESVIAGFGVFFDSDFTRGAIRCLGQGAVTANFSTQTEGWISVRFGADVTASPDQDSISLEISDSSTGQVAFQIANTNGISRFQYFDGGNFITVGATITLALDTIVPLTFHWIIADSGGTWEIYIAETLHASFTGDTLVTNVTSIDQVKLLTMHHSGSSQSGRAYWSECIIGTTKTIHMRLATLEVEADGASSDWTGTVANIDDFIINNDTDFISSTVAAETSTFDVSALSIVASNMVPLAVVIGGRAANAVTGVQNMELVVRTNATDFGGGSVSGLGTTLGPFQEVFLQNPDTVADWTVSDITAIEIGVRSIS